MAICYFIHRGTALFSVRCERCPLKGRVVNIRFWFCCSERSCGPCLLFAVIYFTQQVFSVAVFTEACAYLDELTFTAPLRRWFPHFNQEAEARGEAGRTCWLQTGGFLACWNVLHFMSKGIRKDKGGVRVRCLLVAHGSDVSVSRWTTKIGPEWHLRSWLWRRQLRSAEAKCLTIALGLLAAIPSPLAVSRQTTVTLRGPGGSGWI